MVLEPSRLVATLCETKINKNWGLGGPGMGLRDNWFSVRWSGRHSFAAASYAFSVSHDNGARLFIDDVMVLDRWGTGGTITVNRNLTEGVHPVRLEYLEDAGSASVSLAWVPTTAVPAAAPTASPSATPSPTLAPTPTPSPTPAATPTPTPIATPTSCTRTVSGFTATAIATARDAAGIGGVVCFPAGTYAGNVTASVGSQTWKFDPAATLTGSVTIGGTGVRLTGGTIERPTTDRWTPAVAVRANDATVQSVAFRGGGVGVGVYGKDRTAILSNSFSGLSGSAISIWSEGVGADDTRIENNSIVQAITYRVSPITSRGNESSIHSGVQNARTVIRGNTIDQGPGDVGWFGIELKQSRGTLIEGNTISGGHVLVSLPESDAVTIRSNTFDLRGSPTWGIEVANAHDVIVERNTFIDSGTTAGGHAVSLNSGSLRTTARYNTARDLRTFFDVSGDWHTVTDNCFSSVGYEYEYRSSGGPNITFSRNGACS